MESDINLINSQLEFINYDDKWRKLAKELQAIKYCILRSEKEVLNTAYSLFANAYEEAKNKQHIPIYKTFLKVWEDTHNSPVPKWDEDINLSHYHLDNIPFTYWVLIKSKLYNLYPKLEKYLQVR